MSQNPNPGFNPQAPSFVPNAGAAPFVPGQQFAPSGFYPPQQQFYQQPPGGYPQQFYGNPHPGYAGGYPQGGPPQQPTHAQTAAPVPAPGNVATSAVIEPTLPTVPKAEPLDSWDDVAEAVPEPAPAPPPKAEAVPPPSASAPPKEKKEAKRDDQPATAEISKAVAKSQPTPNLADIETRKEHLNIVFIGHVDAGKSTIGGQLMYLTGMVDKRTLEKYEREAKEKGRESWYLSWALDTNDEEREKGKTVEVGRAFFETEKKHFTILDAPGHKSFVPNMISGATQADLAVLVISARRGEFETGFDRGGQTREHAVLVKTAGVKHLIVLVNKMDDPTVCYDEARYNEVISKLTPYLRQVTNFVILMLTTLLAVVGAKLRQPRLLYPHLIMLLVNVGIVILLNVALLTLNCILDRWIIVPTVIVIFFTVATTCDILITLACFRYVVERHHMMQTFASGAKQVHFKRKSKRRRRQPRD